MVYYGPPRKRLIVKADGASRGNPGPAAIGVVVESESGIIVGQAARRIGETTNNQAEYKALVAGLKLAAELGATHVDINLDSELVVRQLKGQYRVRNAALKPLFREAKQRLSGFSSFDISHISHQQNREAHRLASALLDS